MWRSLARIGTDTLTNLPGIGTSIRTLGSPIAGMLEQFGIGQQQKFIEETGSGKPISVRDVAVTAATLGTLGATAYMAAGGLGAAGAGAASKAATSGTGQIARTATTLNAGVRGKQLIPAGTTVTRLRAIVGKPANTGVDKLFSMGSSRAAVAARYATNAKSTGLTKRWLLKAGVSLFVIYKMVDAFGTYPWAAHNNREATDTLTFGMRKALDNGNLGEYDRLADEFEIMKEEMPKAWAQLPYKNVIDSSVKGMNNAASVKNSMDVERYNANLQ